MLRPALAPWVPIEPRAVAFGPSMRLLHDARGSRVQPDVTDVPARYRAGAGGCTVAGGAAIGARPPLLRS